ncbi:sulfotransferase family protein [Dermatobacter hominis]|uniref:sulfotransferase family protein n=1 Tax=Dermatobacter hominis TaxID=2884263 RepID=UPI0035AC235B
MGLGAALADDVELVPDRLVADAIAKAGGLDDFGPDGWREPLDVLCRAYRDEAGLSAFGTVSVHAQLVQFLTNRLLVEDVVRRHPEALEQEVRAPIVIAGLPRSGTTHLHNLVSADPALRSLPFWEALEPVPAPGEPLFGDGSLAPRTARCDASVAMGRLWTPELDRMHEMSTWHAHEEIHLLSIDCSSMFFDTLAPIPSWREHYRSRDQTPHYRYLRRVLQVLQFLRGGDRWVLKSPQHLEQFGPLVEVFPDATFVVTHRDPGDVAVSMATMVAYAARAHVGSPDPAAIGAHWQRILTELLGAAARDRDLLPADRSIDVRFDDFMADDLGIAAEVYSLAGQPLDGRARAAHAEYLAGHRRNRHGRVVYDAAAVGVDPDGIRSDLAGYRDAFGV